MLDITTAAIVFAICLWGGSQTAFHLGRREGIENRTMAICNITLNV